MMPVRIIWISEIPADKSAGSPVTIPCTSILKI